MCISFAIVCMLLYNTYILIMYLAVICVEEGTRNHKFSVSSLLAWWSYQACTMEDTVLRFLKHFYPAEFVLIHIGAVVDLMTALYFKFL